jgi:glycosyltransferase involved in cell wall biosynthesis/SAM-dependent methyltransferase
MSEKEKYTQIYNQQGAAAHQPDIVPGKMAGGYGRLCWGENMLETLKSWKASSLLDVGCGYGNFCDAASIFVPKVYGLDIASVATGNIIDNPDITFFDGEATHLPLPENAVEWVTSFDCLEHCLEEDIDDILGEFDRVARKGFILSISYEPCEMDGMPLHMTVKPESWWMEKLGKYGKIEKFGKAPITGAPYLICRKPLRPRIICYCAGTLGNRLFMLEQAHALANGTGRSLALVWPQNDPLCPIDFSSLFEPSIQEISEDEMLALESIRIYALVKDVANQAIINGGKRFRNLVKHWGCSDPGSIETEEFDDNEDVMLYQPLPPEDYAQGITSDLMDKLTPTNEISQRIQSLLRELNVSKRILGVHARGTDFGIDVDAYANQIKRALQKNPKQRFLVCSDDAQYEAVLQNQFGNHVITRSKLSNPQKKQNELGWALNNIRCSAESVKEALVDFYLLSQTDFKIYHEYSAYAQLTHAYSTKRYSKEPLSHPNADTRNGQAPPPQPVMVSRGNGSVRILYLCPDINIQSAGIRRLYRHVGILSRYGFNAQILHFKKGFSHDDMPEVPIAYLDQHVFRPEEIVVVPEGFPKIMHALKDTPARRFAIALNWDYVFRNMPVNADWRNFNIERVLTASPIIAEMISWSMGLPTHVVPSGIDHRLYYPEKADAASGVVYIQRKAKQVEMLKKLLASKNPEFITRVKWMELQGLSEAQYAAQIRKASIFLNLSDAEGFPTSCMEAMASGTLVAGYDSVGGREVLVGEGPNQNCLLAPMGDYLSLAYTLAPVVASLLEGNWSQWEPVLNRGIQTARSLTLENEADNLVELWRTLVA